jgi:hypothetical protein
MSMMLTWLDALTAPKPAQHRTSGHPIRQNTEDGHAECAIAITYALAGHRVTGQVE